MKSNARLLINTAFLCAVLFVGAPAKSDELPKFGMTVRDTPLGVQIDQIEGGRPISSKLRRGDILKSYVVLTGDAQGQARPVNGTEALRNVREILLQGGMVEITFLRPVNAGSAEYQQLAVTLEAQHLVTRTFRVETRRVVEYTEQPVSSDAPTIDGRGVIHETVYYATDRKLTDGIYTGARNIDADPIKYGLCNVTLPPNHQPGELERPSWWRLEVREDPEKHVVLKDVFQIGKDGVLGLITDSFDNIDPTRNQILIFVHGYNVSFADAARRTAQLHYDLRFPGPAIFFSWPSNAATKDYVSDSADIAWSTPHIESFLQTIAGLEGVDDVFVIAHSMGTRAVSDAMVRLARSRSNAKIRELILAAPDIDAQVFDRDIAPWLPSVSPRTTVYASANDRALWASETLSEVFRVGEIRNGQPTIRVKPQIDLVDASKVKTDLLGHSYYGDGKTVLGDIHDLITNGNPPDLRFSLDKKQSSNGFFWFFK